MNVPQAVTDRYVTNLMRDGKNRHFELLGIEREISVVDEVCVGIYYKAYVKCLIEPGHMKTCAAGGTPLDAVRRSLSRHGVTFR